MKIISQFLISIVVCSRHRRTIGCPGKCWSRVGDVCIPDTSKIVLDCKHAVGKIAVSMDPCLFTRDSTDFEESLSLFTVRNANQPGEVMFGSSSSCTRHIVDNSTVLEWDWNYAEAESCGWVWGKGDGHLSLGSVIRPSDSIDSIQVQGQTVVTSVTADRDISLQCQFDSTVQLTKNYNNSAPAPQEASFEQKLKLAGFSLGFFKNGSEGNSFIIGEQIESKFSYDWLASGFATSAGMPFGFYPSKCFVQNEENANQQVFLIGSSDSSIGNKCTMDQSILNLNIERDSSSWTMDDFTLNFDAFTFGDSRNLSLTCEVEVCLVADCTTNSARTC